MVSPAGTSLREGLEARLNELGQALDGISEAEAAQSPGEGEWCCKEILSHLTGDEGEGFLEGVRRFVEEDTPLIGVVRGRPNYSRARQAMSLSELRAGVWRQYQGIAEFVGGLSEEDLARKARIPLLKDTPIGEVATLEQWVGAIASLHLPDHIAQVRALRENLGA